MYSLYTFVMSRFYDPRLKGLASHERQSEERKHLQKKEVWTGVSTVFAVF